MVRAQLVDELELLRLLWEVGPSLEGGVSSIEQILHNEHLANALRSTKGLLEGFLGGRTLDSLIYRFVEVYEISLKRKQVQEFFASAGSFLTRIIADPDLVRQDAYKGTFPRFAWMGT
jgi:hypothetical protein